MNKILFNVEQKEQLLDLSFNIDFKEMSPSSYSIPVLM